MLRRWLPRVPNCVEFIHLGRSWYADMERGRFCEPQRRRITQAEDFGVAYTMRFRMLVIFSLGKSRSWELSRILKLQEAGEKLQA
ncbi:uncharacterized protein DS421_6g191470 [Arachis hypogaea]|nr:uncharacterized protein DS421_6g191470 [Arachis hypogaea]